MATLIDGRALAKEVNAHTKQRIEKLKEKALRRGLQRFWLVMIQPARSTRAARKKGAQSGDEVGTRTIAGLNHAS